MGHINDLQLREPDFELGIDTSSYGKEVADVIYKSDQLMEKVKPDALLILGDTYSGLSIMPAANRGIKIFHMEAGLRAWDKRMPEQRNRILIGQTEVNRIGRLSWPFGGTQGVTRFVTHT